MRDDVAQQSTKPPVLATNGKIGRWLLVLCAIPAQYLVSASLDVYLQGYNSWRDSLFVVPIYLVCAVIVAATATIEALPYTRARRPERPPAVYVIARSLISLGVILLPIALPLANNSNTGWQTQVNKILYFVPLACMALAFLSGLALMFSWRWARPVAVFSTAAILASGGVLLHEWFRMTATVPDDWLLFSVSTDTLLWIYIGIALPATAATAWCLIRQNVRQSQSEDNPCKVI